MRGRGYPPAHTLPYISDMYTVIFIQPLVNRRLMMNSPENTEYPRTNRTS